MSNSVVLKGSKYGIMIILDAETPFEQLKEELANKFSQASSFFKNANIAISFKGRELQYWEEKELIDTISDNSMLNVVYVVSDENFESSFHNSITIPHSPGDNGLFYKGTLQSGQILESTSSITVIGDVCSDSKIISNGNVIIIGSLQGSVYAGLSDREDSFIAALSMNPQQIRIGEIVAKCSGKNRLFRGGPNIVYSDDGYIYVQTIDSFFWDNVEED